MAVCSALPLTRQPTKAFWQPESICSPQSQQAAAGAHKCNPKVPPESRVCHHSSDSTMLVWCSAQCAVTDTDADIPTPHRPLAHASDCLRLASLRHSPPAGHLRACADFTPPGRECWCGTDCILHHPIPLRLAFSTPPEAPAERLLQHP